MMALDLGQLVARITADDSRFRRTMDGVHRSLQRVGKVAALTTLAGAATSLAAAMGPAAGGVAALGISLGAAIAPAAGLAVALPAVAVAWQTSMALMKLAVEGFADTLGAAITGDVAKFSEELKKLPPSARAVARELGTALGGLQRTVQSAFFAPIQRQARGVGQQLRGPVQQGAATAAAAMGRVAARALEVAREGRSISFLSRVFRTIAAAADAFGRGVAPLVRGLRDIASVGLKQLPGVAGWLGRAAANTGRWLSSISASGRASRWFTFAVFTLGQMAGIVRNLGVFFRSVFASATAGSGNLLVTINGITAGLARWSTSLSGRNSLDAFFTRGRAVAAQLWRIVLNLGTALAGVLGAASVEGGTLLTTIEQLTARFAAWTQSAEGQQQLSQTFALLGQVARDLLAVLPGIAGVLGVIAQAFNSLPGPVQGVVSQFLAWSIVIGVIGGRIGPLITGLGMVAGALNRVATAALPVIRNVARMAATFVASAARMTGAAVATAARVVAGWVLMGAQALLQAARMAAAWLIAMGPIGLLVAAAVAAVALIIKNWDKIVAFFTKTLPKWIKAGLDFAVKVIKTAARFGFLGPIGLIISHWDKISRFFTQTLPRAVSNGIGNVIGWLRRLPGMVVSAVGDLGKLLVNAGKSILIGLWNGIVSMARWLQRSLVNLVRSIVPGPVARVLGIASPSKVFAGFGANLAEGLALGMERNTGLVEAAAGALAGAAATGGSAATVTRPAPVGAAAGGARATTVDARLLVDSAGSRLDDVLVEVIRRAVRTKGGGRPAYLGLAV